MWSSGFPRKETLGAGLRCQQSYAGDQWALELVGGLPADG